MIKTKIKDSGSFVYMRLQKHECPKCHKRMKLVKMTKTVKAKTKKAMDVGVFMPGRIIGETTKYIWYEFKCPECGAQFRENALRHEEKNAKKEAKKAKKAEKKAAKEAKKADAQDEQ